jgi:hypothetical protein
LAQEIAENTPFLAADIRGAIVLLFRAASPNSFDAKHIELAFSGHSAGVARVAIRRD